jgi:predicted lipid-binding transport protein (Tim44 family)
MKNKRFLIKFLGLGIILAFTLALVSSEVWARAGGGRSGGFRGSRSFSAPRTAPSGTSQFQRPLSPTTPGPLSQPGGSPFLRGLAGGLVGGMLGSMLFGGLGHGAMGSGWGGGGLGMGFLDILIILVLGFLLFRFIRNRKRNALNRNLEAAAYQPPPYQDQGGTYAAPVSGSDQEVETGISHIQSMDPNFNPLAFKDWVQDLFFKIQAAWANQDLSPVTPFLADQMKGVFSQDLEEMKAQNRVNRLDNIAVRSVDITEAWQEEGKDFVTVLFYANLLDYTVDKTSGAVVSGSKTEPVKFREFWTFTRPVGGRGSWQLSAIQQEN